MSVNVSETPNGDHTLSELDCSWDSGDYRLEKSFENAHRVLFAVDATEPLSVGETYSDNIAFILNVVEPLGVSDSLSNAFGLDLKESFAVSESKRLDQILAFYEAMTVSDEMDRSASFARTFFNTLNLLETPEKHSSVTLSEVMTFAERAASDFQKNVSNGLSVSETFNRVAAFSKQIAESIDLAEICGKDVQIPVSEIFSVSEEGHTLDVGKEIIRSLTIAEAMGRVSAFSLSVEEGVSVSDALAKSFELSVEEALEVVDRQLRNADTVVSDLIIGSGDISEDTFAEYLKRQSPVGYRDFREFIEGEYQYEDAIFKIVMDSAGSERALLNKLAINVDLPDVRDRGSASVTSAPEGFYIPFNRKFHVVPEIIVQLTGGTVVAVPDVISSDKNGFTVVLKDTGGNTVAGNISWNAEGY